MTRRELLIDGLKLGAGLLLSRPLSASMPADHGPPPSLKELAERSKVKVGFQASKANLQVPEFAQFVTQNFSLLTPGNELKWPRLHPTPDSYTFDDADWMVNFCQSHGMLVHGHNLCWNSPSANPSWFPSVLTRQNAAEQLTNYISTVMGHYRGQIESWDVVNEPVVFWSHRPDGLYPGVWTSLLGPQYLDIAFHAAKAADPDALRVLNCYYVEQNRPDFERTRELTISLLQQLLKRGVPVQAIGIESHLDATAPFGGLAFLEFIKRVRALGLQVLITELDVNDSAVQGDERERDRVVAQCYYDYLTQVVPAGKVDRIIFWTPSDRWDWLNSMQAANFHRADGKPHRPGLLDESLHPKPALQAVEAALRTLAGRKPLPGQWGYASR
ncbi:MAG: endo-1,4-beta-xylanase [Acidobacteriaceae bacterium]|jgi:endo-1,4-beta-xylanase